MENLSKIKTVYSLIFFTIFFGLSVMAQKSHLFVLKFEGEPYLIKNDTTEVVSKGSLINKKTKLVMKRDDVVYLINNKGDVLKLFKTGTFKHKDLEKLEPVKNNDSYVKNLMTYFWKDFTNTLDSGYNKSGVVVRGDDVKLFQPMDNTLLYTDEIRFEWEEKENKTRPYYFVLKEVGSDKITKIGIQDNSLTLFIDEIYLKYDTSYEWTVIESKYENLDKTEFSSFKLLSKTDYISKKKELDKLSIFLKSIGYDSQEIETLFCVNYKTCL